SSRRRHTRSKRDWSSDVCSSDLQTSLIAQVTTLPLPCKKQKVGRSPGRTSRMSDLPDNQFDVVIIGGGPGGSICARELATRGLRSEERRVGKEGSTGGGRVDESE